MLQSYSPSVPPRQNKSSRPFLSFLKPARPTLSSYSYTACPPSGPPPSGPPPPIPDRPDTSLSILADADTGDTPVKQYPPVRFVTPTRPCHSRNASTPTPQRTPPTIRTRSGTVESSTNTFVDTTPTPPRVIARDFGSSPPARPVDTGIQIGVSEWDVQIPVPVTKGRKRPSPLRLQTTNLIPSPHTSSLSPITPTPNPQVSNINSVDHKERRRSSSTGDLQIHVIPEESGSMPSSGSVTTAGRHRTSRSESAMQLHPPHPHYLTEHGPRATQGRSEIGTPSSTLSTLSALSSLTTESDDTILGSESRQGTSASIIGRYENVPLPWSTHPLSSLLPSLPSQYLPIHLDRLIITNPRIILDPSTFACLSSEETRLQLELDRLKVKHTKLSQHRDKLLKKSFQRVSTVGDHSRGGILGAVEDSIKRVDRVARQVYICNDQLRQMEIMKRDHELGVLLWALQEDKEGDSCVRTQEYEYPYPYSCREEDEIIVTTPVDNNINDPEDPEEVYQQEFVELPTTPIGRHGQSPVVTIPTSTPIPTPVPEIHLTRATIYDPDPEEQQEGCEYLVSPDDDCHPQIEESQSDLQSEDRRSIIPSFNERPSSTISTFSTVSVSLSPINLGFPLPPSRPWPSLDQHHDLNRGHDQPTQTPSGYMPHALSVEGDTPYPSSRTSLQVTYDDLTPTSSSHCSAPGFGSRITIYPPSHPDSVNTLGPEGPMGDMPHTPLISEQDHSQPYSDRDNEDKGVDGVKGLPPLPPLRTRCSKPDIAIYVPTQMDVRPTGKRFRQSIIPARVKAGSGSESESGEGPRTGGTSPLRLVRDKSQERGRYGSQSARYLTQPKVEGQRRTKMVRESGFEGSESILLSLATAESWTKGSGRPDT